jgi:hypothetical protein
MLTSCSENYSNSAQIGVITQLMNSSVPFDFSIDNDYPNQEVINTLDSSAQHGWKVKLVYHETAVKNWFRNRGETDHFVTKVEVLEKNFGKAFNGSTQSERTGRIIDTIYVVIDKTK